MCNLKWNGIDNLSAIKLLSLVDRDTAIVIVKTIILPTIGSEEDICFWEDVILHLKRI